MRWGKINAMPKLYEYFGLVVLFYSNEHEPIHVHGKYQERESRAELIIENGRVVDIRYSDVAGRKPLDARQLRHFKVLVEHHTGDIIQKWIDYFVLHRPITAEKITRKLP